MSIVREFWGIFPQNDAIHRPNPENDVSLTSFEPQSVKIGPAVQLEHVPERNLGHSRTVQSKIHKRAMLYLLGRSSH